MKIACFFLAFIPLFLYEGRGCGRFKKKGSIVSSHTLSSGTPQSPHTNDANQPGQAPSSPTIEDTKSGRGDNSQVSNPSSEVETRYDTNVERRPQPQDSLDIAEIYQSPATPENEKDKFEQPHRPEFNVPKIVIETVSDEEAKDEAEFHLYGDKDGDGGGKIKNFFGPDTPVQTRCTKLHKDERKGRGLVDLTWSPALAEFAAKNAAKCHESSLHYLHKDVVDVPGFSIIGENRYFSSDILILSDAINGWSDDEDESLAKFGFAMAQLISTRVTHVGCGKATCPDPNPPEVTDNRPDKNLLHAKNTGEMREDTGPKWKEDRIYCEYAPGFEPDKEPQLAQPWSSKAPAGWKL